MVDKPLFLLYDIENVFQKTFSWENFIKNMQNFCRQGKEGEMIFGFKFNFYKRCGKRSRGGDINCFEGAQPLSQCE